MSHPARLATLTLAAGLFLPALVAAQPNQHGSSAQTQTTQTTDQPGGQSGQPIARSMGQGRSPTEETGPAQRTTPPNQPPGPAPQGPLSGQASSRDAAQGRTQGVESDSTTRGGTTTSR